MPNWGAMDGPELRKIMLHWPHVLRQATDDWARSFALDIWRLSGNGRWRPTLKQARVMRRMIRDLPPGEAGDEVQLIE